MPNHLLVVGVLDALNEDNVDGVREEVAASVDQGPNVEVAGRVEAEVVIERGMAEATHVEHGEDR